jgi:multidrug resistance protein MdtO
MGLAVYTAVLIWTYPYPAERHLEQTLWVWASLSLGCTVAVLVELIFTRTNAIGQIIMGVTERLEAVEALLRTYAQTDADIKRSAAAHCITGLATVGTGRLHRQIRTARSNDTDLQQYLSELSSAIALVGRLVDVSANMLLLSLRPSASDTIRLQALVREMARIRQFITEKRRPEVCEDFHIDPHVEMPLLPELEKTVALLPQVFTPAGESGYTEVKSPIDRTRWERFLVPDAWTNRDYIRFAIKGCLAVTLCYLHGSGLAGYCHVRADLLCDHAFHSRRLPAKTNIAPHGGCLRRSARHRFARLHRAEYRVHYCHDSLDCRHIFMRRLGRRL